MEGIGMDSLIESETLRVEVYRIPGNDPYKVQIFRFPIQGILWLLAPPELNPGQIFILTIQRLTYTEARAVALQLGLIDREGNPL